MVGIKRTANGEQRQDQQSFSSSSEPVSVKDIRGSLEVPRVTLGRRCRPGHGGSSQGADDPNSARITSSSNPSSAQHFVDSEDMDQELLEISY